MFRSSKGRPRISLRTFGGQTTPAAIFFGRYQQREQKRELGNGHEPVTEQEIVAAWEKVTIMLELYRKTNTSIANGFRCTGVGLFKFLAFFTMSFLVLEFFSIEVSTGKYRYAKYSKAILETQGTHNRDSQPRMKLSR